MSRQVVCEQSMFHSPAPNFQEFIKVCERLRFLRQKPCALHLLPVSSGLFCSHCQTGRTAPKVAGFANSWTDTNMITFSLL